MKKKQRKPESKEWELHEPSFEFTKKLPSNSSAWNGHYFFAYDLVANTKPNKIVELGTHKGNSLFSFAQAIKDFNLNTELHAVDTWKGDEQTGYYGEEVYDTFLEIKDKYYKSVNIIPQKMLFDEAVEKFSDNSIDILHIDGLHTYEAVKHDFEKWLPKVKKDTGIILLHDVCEKSEDFGVYKLWEGLKEKHNTITFDHCHGLGVLFLNKNTTLREEIKHRTSVVYYSSKIGPDFRIETLKKQLKAREKTLSELKNKINMEINRSTDLQKELLEFRGFKKGLIWKSLSIYRWVKNLALEHKPEKIRTKKNPQKNKVRPPLRPVQQCPQKRQKVKRREFPEIHKIDSLKIFCSISQSHVKEVNNTLLPSIKKQHNAPNLEMIFINYLADNKITTKDFTNTYNLKVKVLNPPEKLGFGASYNYAYKKEKPENCFLIINPDVALDADNLSLLLRSFDQSVGLIEARQLPFTHPKDCIKEKTFETNWVSGSCLLVNSNMFEEIGGFDENYWMYLEDVDLSWRSWIAGYKVLQNPRAIANHFTGLYFKYDNNSYTIEHFWSIRNFLYISYKFFGRSGLQQALEMVDKLGYKGNLKTKAISNFKKLKARKTIEQVDVPDELNNLIHIFGYNKFSEYPS